VPCRWFTSDEINGHVALRLGRSLDKVEADGDRVRLHFSGLDGAREELLVDHVIARTGYRADSRRVAFISSEMRLDNVWRYRKKRIDLAGW
jgi:2-polyprenyl-6-methoxyphenol hydroxylase-like FAD-dependent oxidoreductase